MKITVTTLVDNSVSAPGCQAEHGLSFYIESPNENILFDTGASSLFAKNASKLGLELFGAEVIILSHGHSDHSGGLATALRECPRANLYLHRNSVLPMYSISPEGKRKQIGISDRTLKAIVEADQLGNVKWIDDKPAEISQNATLLTSSLIDSKKLNSRYFRASQQNGKIEADDFSHEISLVISGARSSCLFTACSHLGVLDIISASKKIATKPLTHVFGGIHTFKDTLSEVRRLAEQLSMFDIKFYLGHCTGLLQFAEIYSQLGDKILPLGSGSEFEVEI